MLPASIHMDIIANKILSLISILSLQARVSDKHVRLARGNRLYRIRRAGPNKNIRTRFDHALEGKFILNSASMDRCFSLNLLEASPLVCLCISTLK